MKVKEMVVTCPICCGKGKVEVSDNSVYTDVKKVELMCFGCGGKGWVEVMRQGEVDENGG